MGSLNLLERFFWKNFGLALLVALGLACAPPPQGDDLFAEKPPADPGSAPAPEPESPNSDPEVSLGCSASLTQDTAYSCSPSVTDADAGQSHVWKIANTSTCGPWIAIDPLTGQVNGTPDDESVGTCTLSFEVGDSAGGKATVSVDLTVDNVAPTLSVNDAGSIGQGASMTVIRTDASVQASEEGFGVYSFNNAMTTSPKCADNGTLQINSVTGQVSFQPGAFAGICHVKVSFDDENGMPNSVVSDEFSITVFSNTLPTVSGTCPSAVDQDAAYSCTPSVIDPDAGDTHTWSATGNHTCDWATVNPSTGVIGGTPGDDDVGNCLIALVANDGVGDSNELQVSVAINNLAPTLSILDAADINEDSSATVIRDDAAVQASEEGFGVYSVNDTSTTAPKCSNNGMVSVNTSNGAVTYTPAADYVGICYITVEFDDQNGLGSSKVTDEFAVTVLAQNDPPVITATCSTSVTQDVVYTTCSPGIVDPDGGVPAWSLAATNTCSWLSINSSNGQVTGTPDDDDVGSCTLAFKANDGSNDSNVLSFTVNVTNLAPTLSVLDAADISKNSPATVIRDDAAVQASEEGFGSYSLDNATATSPKCSDNGTVSINTANGEVTYTPAASYVGTCNVKVAFDDENELGNSTVSDEFQISVLDNVAPTISASCSLSVREGIAYTTCSPGITDPDGGTPTWSFDATHNCGWLSINSVNGQIDGTPGTSDVGSCTLAFKVNDGAADSNVLSFSVSVDPAPEVPILSFVEPVNGTYSDGGGALLFQVNFAESVTVSGGIPRIALDIGGSTVYATYQSGSGSANLEFSYTIQSGDDDSDGIGIPSAQMDLNGSQIVATADSFKDAQLDFTAELGSLTGVLVDTSSGITPPNQVTGVTTSPTTNATTLSVSWTVPNDNGTAIIDYSVQYREQGTTTWLNVSPAPATNSVEVTSLSSGVTYEIRVAANNGLLGAYSAISTAEIFDVMSLNPVLWLSSTNITNGGTEPNNGDRIATWHDITGSATNATEATTSKQPVYQTNVQGGLPAVRFSDLDRGLEGSFNRSNGTDLTFVIVGQFDSGFSDRCMFEFNGGGSARGFFIDRRYAGNTTFSPALTKGSFNIWTIQDAGSSSVVTENSVTELHNASNNFNTDFTGTGNYVLGDDMTGSNRMSGYIGEFLVFDTALTPSQISTLETYLKNKWGL